MVRAPGFLSQAGHPRFHSIRRRKARGGTDIQVLPETGRKRGKRGILEISNFWVQTEAGETLGCAVPMPMAPFCPPVFLPSLTRSVVVMGTPLQEQTERKEIHSFKCTWPVETWNQLTKMPPSW